MDEQDDERRGGCEGRLRVGDRVLRKFGDDEQFYVLGRVVAVNERVGKRKLEHLQGDSSHLPRRQAGFRKTGEDGEEAGASDEDREVNTVDVVDCWHCTAHARHNAVPESALLRISAETHHLLWYTGTQKEKAEYSKKLKKEPGPRKHSSVNAAAAGGNLRIAIPRQLQRVWALYMEGVLNGGEPCKLPRDPSIEQILAFWKGSKIDRDSQAAEFHTLLDWFKRTLENLIPRLILPPEMEAHDKFLRPKTKPRPMCKLYGIEHLVLCLLEFQEIVLEAEKAPTLKHSAVQETLLHPTVIHFINGLCAFLVRGQSSLFPPEYVSLPVGVVPPHLDRWRTFEVENKQG
ncbi:hypothetical protein FVE85_2016 [Porphyridium purpureum]|uniref:MRG domain-containing protein n=1 Tax=Porphyridium purpureum TaxID=35688 RepID=A0A5J4YWF1_PORPP|nr:hypothetical protein FVE85_2016 [Porphyridium purpureum]|eukprot:POR5677..scf209_3